MQITVTEFSLKQLLQTFDQMSRYLKLSVIVEYRSDIE